jgi:hypothetical protein
MSKREVVAPRKGDKRYARRDAQGPFTESQVDVRALPGPRTGAANRRPRRPGDGATAGQKKS